jgi:uncharacterized protein (DUF58 family)
MQRDRVGLVTFDKDIIEYVPPSAKHLQLLLHSLARTQAAAREAGEFEVKAGSRAATLDEPLKKLAESMRRRSIVLLISDLYEEPDAIISALTNVRGRGNDLIVFQLLDHSEIDFTFTDATNFIDLETGEKMPVIPDYLRDSYRQVVAEHTATLERRTREQGIDYQLFDTSKPLDQALFTFLLARERLGGRR